MLDVNAPGAWKFEDMTVAQVRKLQQGSRAALNKRATQFETLDDIDSVYRLRCFCEGFLEELQKDGLMGDSLSDLISMVKKSEEQAKRRLTKAMSISDPYRLPTFREWSRFGLTTPQIKVPRLLTIL